MKNVLLRILNYDEERQFIQERSANQSALIDSFGQAKYISFSTNGLNLRKSGQSTKFNTLPILKMLIEKFGLALFA